MVSPFRCTTLHTAMYECSLGTSFKSLWGWTSTWLDRPLWNQARRITLNWRVLQISGRQLWLLSNGSKMTSKSKIGICLKCTTGRVPISIVICSSTWKRTQSVSLMACIRVVSRSSWTVQEIAKTSCPNRTLSNSRRQVRPAESLSYTSGIYHSVDFQVPHSYEFVRETVVLPKIPGSLVQFSCEVIGYPYSNVYWKIDGAMVPNRPLNDVAISFDSAFSVARNLSMNSSQTILITHLNKIKEQSLYECFLNHTILVKQYNVSVIGKFSVFIRSHTVACKLIVSYKGANRNWTSK